MAKLALSETVEVKPFTKSITDEQIDQALEMKIQAMCQDLKIKLTPRESQVTRLLCEGDSDKRIALRLGGLSTETIRGHLRHIRTKFIVPSRGEIAALLQRYQIVTFLRLEKEHEELKKKHNLLIKPKTNNHRKLRRLTVIKS